MQQTPGANGLAQSQNIVYTEQPSYKEEITHQGTITTIRKSTFAPHFITTCLLINDGSQQPVSVAANIATHHNTEKPSEKRTTKYIEARGAENEEYLLHQ